MYFKSKRYRDKLRCEIKLLESLLPVDRTSLNRKLDSQTVFRLVLSYFRSKLFFKELLILDGFVLLLTSDGTVLYVTDNVLQYVGFNQVDLLHRCIYGIVHPDDHHDLKMALEQTLQSTCEFSSSDISETDTCKPLSFICRMKYFNGSSAGYLKMHCSGKILHQSDVSSNSRSSNQMVFLFIHPYMFNRVELSCNEGKTNTFWSKHEMDLKIREIDAKCEDILGTTSKELQDRPFYSLLHPEDLSTFAACHRALTESTDVQTIYFRLETKDKRWKWFQSRGKVLTKNSKKFSIVFSHCPLSEDDSTYIQQETIIRQKYAIGDLYQMLISGDFKPAWRPCGRSEASNMGNLDDQMSVLSYTQPEDLAMSLQSTSCPSSWHMLGDRHSPVLPSNHVAHKIMQHEKQRQFLEFKRSQRQENHYVVELNNMATVDCTFSHQPEYLYLYGGDPSETCLVDTVEPDLDESGHMKIVETETTDNSSRPVDLPSIGSFLEYLNEV
ncbi:aryl hydrocarbon receptor-like [Patella vulgata]|uniref:aryl hydrocarbon receptor-like n=1 Tax=Patella vulgata TaxID=6465 RepID=UPI00217FAC00|nr:aryl hydrocarbon receptor-like [Patella vulgata]